MSFFVNIRRSYHEWRYSRRDAKRVKAATVPPRGFLFNSSGWGPTKTIDKLEARPYRGPLYPEPAYGKFNPRKLSQPFSSDAAKLCNKAREAWSQGQLEAAATAYAEAIAAAPKNPDFLFEKSQFLWAEGDLIEARNLLDKAIELDPDFAAARASRIRISLKQGDKSNLRFDFGKLHCEAFDFGIRHAVGDEVRPALGISNE